MLRLGSVLCALLFTATLALRPAPAVAQATSEVLEVSFPNGSITLSGFVWKPIGPGPFPAVVWNHGSEQFPGDLANVAATFLKAGYVFFIPHRRGHGRSAAAGPYIVDQLAATPNTAAWSRLLVDLHHVHLTDQLAAVAFLAARSYVDANRIGTMGFSFGGIQTFYAIGNAITSTTTSVQGNTMVIAVSDQARAGVGRYRVAVSCSAAAQSWSSSPELQTIMRAAAVATRLPVYMIQAQNDYSLVPHNVLSADMTAAGNPNKTRVYPPNGMTNQDGHEFCINGMAVWGPDVLAFIAAKLGAPVVDVVEYYNAVLDHYFITWIPAEQAILDAGNTPTRWARTGSSFRANLAARPGTSPVCRYYIPPDKGDSHFFGRGTAECNATGAANPSFILEDPQFMHLFLPVAGVCPDGTTPIYRAFSNRPDANHRYMILRAIRDQMIGLGWLAEGDGPDLVVMCGT